MRYSIKIKKNVKKLLFRLPNNIVKKVSNKIDTLSENPRPVGCKKITNTINKYRIRIGNYRILYSINDDILIIEVIKIAHRKDIYRNL
jgi:mRNA interferase RelE/StbE